MNNAGRNPELALMRNAILIFAVEVSTLGAAAGVAAVPQNLGRKTQSVSSRSQASE
jgi:hypothetical protein